MLAKNNHGKERESLLAKETYYSDNYFDKIQLYSLSNQIADIHDFAVKSMIEIGIGNGFVSSFLKKSGVEVKTFDINPNLDPDVCCSIEEVPNHISKKYDLTACCEVLEHMPFDEFQNSIDAISRISKNAYITLPNSKKSFGFGGLLRLPKLPPKKISFYLAIRSNRLGSGHYWELGSEKSCSIKNIKKILLFYFENVIVERYSVNPYHVAFKCYESKSS